MKFETRQISATVDLEVVESIQEMADEKRKTFSAMVAILLTEAAEKFEKSKKLSHAKS